MTEPLPTSPSPRSPSPRRVVERRGSERREASAALGFGFIAYASRLWGRPGIEGAKALYLYSLAYLALLFAAMMVDAAVSGTG